MPWLETNVLEQRLRFVSATHVPGANRRALCRVFGISPPTAYKWLARYAALGAVGGLSDQSRRPRQQPRRTAAAVEARVVALRQHYGGPAASCSRYWRPRGTRSRPPPSIASSGVTA